MFGFTHLHLPHLTPSNVYRIASIQSKLYTEKMHIDIVIYSGDRFVVSLTVNLLFHVHVWNFFR